MKQVHPGATFVPTYNKAGSVPITEAVPRRIGVQRHV